MAKTEPEAPLVEGVDIPAVTETDKAKGRFHEHVRKCRRCTAVTSLRLASATQLCDQGFPIYLQAVWLVIEDAGLPHLVMH